MPKVIFTFDDEVQEVEVAEGDTILKASREYKLPIEGACGGEMACATCHVILSQEWYDKLPDPSDDEQDMLDIADGLTATSRLGCQIKVTKELDGLEVKIASPDYGGL